MPTTGINSFANERQLYRNYWGTELILGTSVTPTYRMYGDLRLTRSRPIADRNEYAGTFFKDYTAVRGGVVVDGTYAQNMTYEDAPILYRYSVQGGVAGVTDGNATPGYTWTQKPTASRKDIDFISAELGYPGFPFTSTGLHFPEFTISGDIDNAEACWMFNARALALTKNPKANALSSQVATGGSTSTVVKAAAGWTVNAYAGAFVEMLTGTAGNIGQKREIVSNDATTLTLAGYLPSAVVNTDTFSVGGVFTTGIADRVRETIEAPGTKLYLDTSSAIGTTEVPGRMISFSVNYNVNSSGKRFMDNTTGYSRFGFGATVVTGQVRLEGDDRDEYDAWIAGTDSKIRIKQTGSVIDSGAGTTKSAQIDIPFVEWDALTEDDRENNVTFTLTFRGMVDPSAGYPGQFVTKNKLSVLP
jgi:hypothetical protein